MIVRKFQLLRMCVYRVNNTFQLLIPISEPFLCMWKQRKTLFTAEQPVSHWVLPVYQCINAALASIYRNGIRLVVCLPAHLEKYCVQAAPSNRWHFLTSTSPRTNRCSSLNGTHIPLLIEMTRFPSHSFRYDYSSLFAFATCPERCGSTRGHPCLMVKRLDRGTDHSI